VSVTKFVYNIRAQEHHKTNLNSLIFLDNKSPPICHQHGNTEAAFSHYEGVIAI
jgi:hypothetical protein